MGTQRRIARSQRPDGHVQHVAPQRGAPQRGASRFTASYLSWLSREQEGLRLGRSTGSSASLTEGHSGQLFFETALLLRIEGTRQAVGQLNEAFSLLFPRFDGRLGWHSPRVHQGAQVCPAKEDEADLRYRAIMSPWLNYSFDTSTTT